MAKRKEVGTSGAPVAKRAIDNDDSDSSSDEDTDMLDVEFEWFDPQEIDFHGLKLLLRQLFDVDNDLFDLSALSNLILSQPLLGSTVKVPDDDVGTNQTDPFAFLTVLNLHTHREKPEIKALTEYLIKKASSTPAMSSLANLLSPSSSAQVGLILTERFINMPPEIVPPMYKMLVEEIQWAVEAKEPYTFSHYLVLSKTYTEVVSKLDEETQPPQRKKKKSAAAAQAETFYFHPEDEKLHEFALAYGNYDYTKPVDEGASDSRRAFQDAGVRPQGHLILIEGNRFAAAVKAVEEYIGAAQA